MDRWCGRAAVLASLCGSAGSVSGQALIHDGTVRMVADRGPIRVGDLWTPPFVEELFDAQAVPSVVFGGLNLKPIVAEDEINDALSGVPMRIGVDRALPPGPVSSATSGVWHHAADGSNTWSLRIDAPGAKMLRVHFSAFDVPEGAFVLVRGADLNIVDMYENTGPIGTGEFWSIMTGGEFVEIQYQAPPGVDGAPVITIDQISHIYRTKPLLANADGGFQERVDLACHEDVMCHTVDATARDSVGRMVFTDGGTFLCSGGLLNDADPNTFAGYFLTANHCISTQASVNSLTVYWFYQKLSCNGVTPALASRPTSIGGTLLWTSAGNDSTFIRLANDPQDGQGFAAWSTASLGTNATVFGIHHPNGEYKRYSEGDITSNNPRCLGVNFWYLDFFVGAVEGGSSGSPLFNQNWEVTGQLFGSCGAANCTNQNVTNITYGKFSVTYNNVSSWLESVATDDSYEDNDTFATAAALAEGPHGLYLVDFDDYFSFTLDCDRDIVITAAFLTSEMNLDLELINSSETVIASSNSTTGAESITESLTAGDYVIRANKVSGWGGAYSLILDLGGLCFDDCNNNGVDDLIDIANGDADDCNANLIPDSCDVVPGNFFHDSGVLSPIGFLENRTYVITAAPQADSDVTLSFEASGDFSDADENLTVIVGGTAAGVILIAGADCPLIPDTDQLLIPQATWNTEIANGGGNVTIFLLAPSATSALECPTTWVRAVTQYTTAPFSQDLDQNGIPDECGVVACSEADITTTGAGAGDPGFGVPDGQVTGADINYYVNIWVVGCP